MPQLPFNPQIDAVWGWVASGPLRLAANRMGDLPGSGSTAQPRDAGKDGLNN